MTWTLLFKRLPCLTVAISAIMAWGCCDPLADGNWHGHALFQIRGWVHLALSPEEYAALDYLREGELRTAIFWAPTRGSSYSLASAVEQDVSTVGSFPAQFELSVHQPPPTELLREADDGNGSYAVGLVVAYRDLNDNGRWDRNSERLVGGAADRFVLHTPDGLESQVFGNLEAGFHRIVPNVACDNGVGTVRYLPDAATEIALIVGRGFPAEVALQLDCGGRTIAWEGACPPLHMVRQTCASDRGDLSGEDPMCRACRQLLAPMLNDEPACRRWLEGCLLRFPSEECRREAIICAGTPPPTVEPPPPTTCDATCECQRHYETCLDANPGAFEPCRQRLETCMAMARTE